MIEDFRIKQFTFSKYEEFENHARKNHEGTFFQIKADIKLLIVLVF
jgi:hypothetical protein